MPKVEIMMEPSPRPNLEANLSSPWLSMPGLFGPWLPMPGLVRPWLSTPGPESRLALARQGFATSTDRNLQAIKNL
jgi:hypothetical protein